MGDQPNNDHDGKQKKCRDCNKFAKDPIVGHFKCAAHRACTSRHEWQPYECDMCLFFKHNVSRQPAEEKNSSIDELAHMLQDTSVQLSCSETTWEYEDILYSFLDLERPESNPSQSKKREEENPKNSGEASGTEHNTEQHLNKNGDKLPSTNDMLYKMMGGIQELVDRLPPKECNTKSKKMKSKRRSRRSRRSPSLRADDDSTSEESEESSTNSRRRKQKTNAHSRKRPRSPSPVSDESSDKDTSEYPSDTDPHSNSSDSSRSPHNRPQPRSKRRGRKEFFNEGSTIYFYTGDYKVVANKVWFNGELRDVKWHRSVNAFSLINTTVKDEVPFMSATQAHESLVSFFKATQDPAEKPGLDRKSYQRHFDDNSGLARALRLIVQGTSDALHHLHADDIEAFWKTFSNTEFKPSSMVNFSSGWTLTGDNYLEWAKFKKLDPFPFSKEVRLGFTPYVPGRFLEAECKARAQLVDSITGLSMLDSLAKEFKDNAAAHSAVEAISKHYSSLLGDTVLRWLAAKADIRIIVLQGSQCADAIDLLQSSMWEPTIFAADAVKSLKENNIPRMLMADRLEVKEATNKFYQRCPAKVNPDKLKRKTKPQKKDIQFFRRKHSPIRYGDRTQDTSKFNLKFRQLQDKANNWGSQNQTTGNAPQNRKNKNKSWNKPKQSAKGQSGNSGAFKRKRNAQQ